MAAHLLLRSANGAAREIAALPGLRLTLQPGETLVFPMGAPGILPAGDDLQLVLPPDGARLVLEGFLAALRKGDAVAIETVEQRLDTLAEVVALSQPAAGDPLPAPADLPGSGAGLVTAPVFEAARLDQAASPAPIALGEIVRTVFTAVVPEVLRPLETSAVAVGALVSELPIAGGAPPPPQPILPVLPPPAIPSLIVAPAAGAEDSTIALSISASPNQAGDVVTVTIAGVPAGASLSAGSNLGGGVWSLSLADLVGLTMRPPLNQQTDFVLTVTATAESGGQAASSAPAALAVDIAPVVDALFTAGSDTVDLSGPDVTVPDFVNPWAQDGNRSNALGGDDIVTLASGGPNALASNVTFFGGTGSDTVIGGTLDDIIDGGSEADFLIGNDGNDRLLGGAGADTLVGGAGADRLDGGTEDDVLVIAAQADYAAGESLIGGTATDTVRFASTTAGETLTLVNATTSGVERFVVADAAGDASGMTALNIDASAIATAGIVLAGNEGANTLVGGAGANTILGNGGNDTLVGGDGADTVDGGAGDDVLIVASSAHFDAGESLIGGQGTDTLRFTSTTANQALAFVAGAPPSGIEIFAIADASGATTGTTALSLNVAVSASAVTLIGNNGNNSLTATAGADTIFANAGNDTVFAGLGADSVDLGIGNDVLVIAAAAEHAAGEALDGGAGSDTIRFASTTAGETLALLAATTGFEAVAIANAAGTTTGTTALNLDASLVGNGLALTGNNGANTITGTALADTIVANAGNDVIVIADATHYAAGETLNGGSGTDTVRFASTTDGQTLAFAGGAATSGIEAIAIATAAGVATGTTALNVDASALTGTLSITGNDGANMLVGTSGATTILGNGGNDTITGGDGADRLDGGAGDDVFLLATSAHYDAGETVAGGDGLDTLRFTSTTAGQTLTLLATTTELERVAIGDDQGGTAGTTTLNVNAASVATGLEILGNDGVNTMIGTNADDLVQGNGGNDTITGRGGADTLAGGAGSDDFLYSLLSEAGDRILDFDFATSTTRVDRLGFQDDAFGGAGVNIGNANESFTFRSGGNAALNLAGTEFGVKTDATVANDQAVVQALIDSFTNVTTGALFLFSDGTDAHVWFDPNPSVVGGAVEVATLVGQTLASLANVDASDIRVI